MLSAECYPAADTQSSAMSGGRIPLPYPGSQAELNSVPLGLRGVGLACSEEWPCFWHSLAPPLSRQLEGLDVAPAAGAVAMAAAAAARRDERGKGPASTGPRPARTEPTRGVRPVLRHGGTPRANN